MTTTHPSNPSHAQARRTEIFQLTNADAYKIWRASKLDRTEPGADDLLVDIADLGAPAQSEADAIRANCCRFNMSFFRLAEDRITQTPETTRENLNAFARVFGLRTTEAHRSAGADGIVALEVTENRAQAGYIPYTNRKLSWHTDGYYNYHGPDHAIRAMAMYCARPARSGGENAYLDPHIAYIRLRDETPEFIRALMEPDAMTIPENREENGKIRAANTGPVFFTDANGQLAMRYSARTRNIIWKDDTRTNEAVACLNEILTRDPMIIRKRLAAGEGVICNNVLHMRTGFDNENPENSQRLIYRSRFYEPVC